MPDEGGGENDTLWAELEALDKLSNDRATASGAEGSKVKELCEAHGLNVQALQVFRRLNRKPTEKQADFMRTFEMLSPRLSYRDQGDIFEEGR